MIKKLMRHRAILLMVVASGVAAAAAVTVGSGAFAASGRQAVRRHVVRRSSPRWRFAVFSHPAGARARAAAGGKVSAPQGAILADVSDVAGVSNEYYAWHRAPQEDCLVDVEGGSEMTVACSPSYAAEAEGVAWVGTNSGATGTAGGVTVAAMVPDGVSQVEVTAGDGSTTAVTVTNNVAVATETGVKAFRYTLPDGRVVSHNGEALSAKDGSH